MTITRFTNIPFDELIRLVEDSNDELGIELIRRIESKSEDSYDQGHQDGYQEGCNDVRNEGQDDIIARLGGMLCLACTRIVEEL